MARPIFVVGLNRSGTKWLSNELAKHPQIACVRNEKTGIRETNMFRGFGRKFNLKILDEYIGLVELWAATDFFERTGVDKSHFYTVTPVPRDTYEMFHMLMDAFAEKQGAQFWLQKAQPMAGLELAVRFPEAAFVIIRREMLEQVRSQVKLTANRSWLNLARATSAHVRDSRLLRAVQQLTNCTVVEYADLLGETKGRIDALLTKWGLETMVEGRIALEPLTPNSSFTSSQAKATYFTKAQILWIRAIAGLVRLIPYPIMRWNASRSWRRVGPLVPGTFANVERKYPRFKQSFGCASSDNHDLVSKSE